MLSVFWMNTHIYSFNQSARACNHTLYRCFQFCSCGTVSIIVQWFLQTAYYRLRDCTFIFILQFLCTILPSLIFLTFAQMDSAASILNPPASPLLLVMWVIFTTVRLVSLVLFIKMPKLLNRHPISPNRWFSSNRAHLIVVEGRVSLLPYCVCSTQWQQLPVFVIGGDGEVGKGEQWLIK